MTLLCIVMLQGHRFKGGMTKEVFQWERGASVAAGFALFNFQDIVHTQKHIKH